MVHASPVVRLLASVLLANAWLAAGRNDSLAADDDPPLRPVAEVKRDKPVDFEHDILPLLKKNCLACHNTAEAEGSLVLETPQTIAKGGDNGPAVIAKKAAESLLLVRARGGGDGLMPPEDNKAAAVPFSPEELGLIKRWIDEGATGTVRTASATIHWQPLPPGVNPIFAVTTTPDGQYAICGRANQIFVYQVPTGRLVGRLTDPALLKSKIYTQPGVADLDLIQSLAASPDGSLLASGGYQTIKLWRHPQNVQAYRLDQLSDKAVLPTAVDDAGKTLAVVRASGEIELLDAANGKPLRKLTGSAGPITAIEFGLDGAKLYAADGSTLRFWNVADGKMLGELKLDAPIKTFAVVDGGKQVAIATGDKQIVVRELAPADLKKAAPRTLSGHAKPVTALTAFHKNPKQLASADADGLVIVWDIGSGKSVRQLKHGGAVAALALSQDDAKLASAGSDKIIRLWSMKDGKQLAELRGDARAKRRLEAATRAAALTKAQLAESKTAVTDAEKQVTTETDSVKKATDAQAAAAKALPDKQAAEQKLVAPKKTADDALAAADAALKAATDAKAAADKAAADAETTRKQLADAATKAKADAKKSAKDKKLQDASVSADKAVADLAPKLAAVKKSQTDAQKQLADAQNKQKQAKSQADAQAKTLTAAEQARAGAESSLKVADKSLAAAQGALVKAKDRVAPAKAAITTAEKSVAEADAALAAATKTATEAEHPFTTVAFSADGTVVATGNASALVQTWAADSGMPLDSYEAHAGAIRSVAPVGNLLVSAGADGQAIAWDTLPEWSWVRTLGAGASLPIDRVTALDFSPDGRLLASGGGAPSRSGELKLWNVDDGSLVREIPDAHSDTILGVRFSPDGKLLATGGTDKFVKVFEVATGKFVRAFEGHTHHVLAVAWQSDGKTLASAGADNVVKVWDLASGEQKKTITGFGKEVTSIAFLADTPDLLATSGDKTIRRIRTTDGANVRGFGGPSDFVYSGAASDDGKVIVAGGQDSVLRVYNADNGQVIRNFDPPPVK